MPSFGNLEMQGMSESRMRHEPIPMQMMPQFGRSQTTPEFPITYEQISMLSQLRKLGKRKIPGKCTHNPASKCSTKSCKNCCMGPCIIPKHRKNGNHVAIETYKSAANNNNNKENGTEVVPTEASKSNRKILKSVVASVESKKVYLEGGKDDSTKWIPCEYIVPETRLIPRKLVGRNLTLGMVYKINMEVKGTFGNVISIKNYAKTEHVQPGIWFHKMRFVENLGNIQVNLKVNGEILVQHLKGLYLLNQWQQIMVMQQFIDGSYIYSITINNKVVFSTTNKKPEVFTGVDVYTAYDASQAGSIRDLIIFHSSTDSVEGNASSRDLEGQKPSLNIATDNTIREHLTAPLNSSQEYSGQSRQSSLFHLMSRAVPTINSRLSDVVSISDILSSLTDDLPEGALGDVQPTVISKPKITLSELNEAEVNSQDIFFVEHPPAWALADIHKLFSPYCKLRGMNIIDKKSCFVTLDSGVTFQCIDNIIMELVMKTESLYNVVPYCDYLKNQQSSRASKRKRDDQEI